MRMMAGAPAMATLEENTDVIVGIFKHYGLDPKKHNIFPVEEETEQNAATEAAEEIVEEYQQEETEQNAATEASEENVEEYQQNQIVEEISLEVEFEGPNDEIDDEAFSESVDKALQQIVDEAVESLAYKTFKSPFVPGWLHCHCHCHSWRRSVEQTSGPHPCHKCSLHLRG